MAAADGARLLAFPAFLEQHHASTACPRVRPAIAAGGGCFPEMKRDDGREGVRAECEREGHNQVLFGSGRGHEDHRLPQTNMGETRNTPRVI